jgi:outer membrane PBP1 activator LpoA protein
MRQALGQAFQQVKPASTGKRRILARAAACGFTLAVAGAMPAIAQSKDGKLKVGLMLPYTGTFAALGNASENGFRLHLNEHVASSVVARSNWSKSMTNQIRLKPLTTSTSSLSVITSMYL